MKRKELVFGAIMIATTASLMTIAFEVLLRATGRPFKGTLAPAEESIAQFDPDTGWSYIPNHSMVQHFGDAETEVAIHIDEDGMRVRTEGATLSADRRTILLVGGSFMMGHGVNYEDSVAGHLEEALPGYQIVNAAVQGFGTDQALVRLRNFVARYDTRAVVYGFVCDHLRRNAYEDRRILLPGARFPGTKPAFRVTADGIEQWHAPVRAADRKYLHAWMYARIDWAHFGPQPTAALSRALLLAMKETAEAQHALFTVVDWEIRGTPALCADDPLRDLDVDLIRPAVDPPDGWATWFIPGDYHPDGRSHAFVADRIAERLRSLGLD